VLAKPLLNNAATRIQKVGRKQAAKKSYQRKRSAATQIQRASRYHLYKPNGLVGRRIWGAYDRKSSVK
jgi:hypothetical protein